MALTIEPVRPKVALGKELKLKPKRDGKRVDPFDLTWSIDDDTVASIFQDGTVIPENVPVRPTVSVTATDGTDTVTKKVEIQIAWPEGWPYLADDQWGWDDLLPWSDDDAPTRAALILYDVLSQLPEEFVETIGPVPIVRLNQAGQSFAEYLRMPWAHTVYIRESQLKGLKKTDAIEQADLKFAAIMVHELAHAYMSQICGGGEAFGKAAVMIAELLVALPAQYVSVTTSIAVVPAIPWLVGGGLARWLIKREALDDQMSEFCEAVEWSQRDVGSLDVPLLGLLLPWVVREAPNAVSALGPKMPGPLAWLYDVRNANFEREKIVALEEKQKSRNDPGVQKLAKAGGLASPYGAQTPHEDFAEVVTALALARREKPAGGGKEARSFRQANAVGWNYSEPSAKRRTFVKEHLGLFGTGWTGVHVGKTLGAWAKAPTKLSEWTIDVTPAKVSRKAGQAASNGRRFNADLWRLLGVWDEGVGREFEHNRKVLSELSVQADPARPLTFLAALELHGDGLRRYRDEKGGAKKGDVVVTRDADVFMALGVDDRGRVAALTGATPIDQLPERGVREVPRDDAGLRFTWSASSTPRTWAGRPGPYADIDAALRGLVQLWGDEEHPTVASFLARVLDAAGLAPERKLPRGEGEAVLQHALGLMQSLGDGLVPYDPGAVPLQPGDVIVPFHRSTLGVLTRVTDDGLPVDAVMGGTFDDGPLGEPAGVVRMVHDLDPHDVHLVWRPSAASRRFTQDAMPTIFTDLDRSLANLAAHDGAKQFRRGERTWSAIDGYVALLNLMLEAGADSRVRGALRDLGWEAPDSAVRNFMYTHGDPGARRPVAVGDLIATQSRGALTPAVVLAAGGDGGAAQVATVIAGDRIEISSTPVAPEAIVEHWTPSTEPRALPAGHPSAAFYGERCELFELAATRERSQGSEHLRLGDDDVLQVHGHPHGVANLLARRAPEWVRRRLWDADGADQIRARCDTLGAGVERFDAARPTPVGTWVWLAGGGGFGAVLSVDADGAPAMVLAPGTNSVAFTPVTPADVHEAWLPSAEARAYATGAASAGYADVNRAIGQLCVWSAERAKLTDPLFGDRDLLATAAFDDALRSVLSRGPDQPDAWPAYLEARGTVADGAPRAGDLLLFEDPARQAIALSPGEMAAWSGESGGPLELLPLEGHRAAWRPGRAP